MVKLECIGMGDDGGLMLSLKFRFSAGQVSLDEAGIVNINFGKVRHFERLSTIRSRAKKEVEQKVARCGCQKCKVSEGVL